MYSSVLRSAAHSGCTAEAKLRHWMSLATSGLNRDTMANVAVDLTVGLTLIHQLAAIPSLSTTDFRKQEAKR